MYLHFVRFINFIVVFIMSLSIYRSERSVWEQIIILHKSNLGQIHGKVGEIGKYTEMTFIEGLRVPAHTK